MAKKWTEDELNILRNNFLKDINELVLLLPIRNRDSIYKKLQELRLLKINKNPNWTDEEISLLYDTTKNSAQLLSLFPNRTPEAICLKRNKLGIKVYKDIKWMDYEDDILKSLIISGMSISNISKCLSNKSNYMVRKRCKELDLFVNSFNVWTDEEIKILYAKLENKYYSNIYDILHLFENSRTYHSVRHKCRQLGINLYKNGEWTYFEENILYNSYLYGIKILQKLLPDRTKSAINNHANILNINIPYLAEWTKDEIDLLKNLCNNSHTYDELTQYFPKYNINQIRSKCESLKINKFVLPHPIFWSKKEIDLLYSLHESNCDIDTVFNEFSYRNIFSIKTKIKELELCFYRHLLSRDGKTVLNSGEEKRVFDFIYYSFKLNLKKYKRSLSSIKFNIDDTHFYVPDFIIEDFGKPIIIEYYGMMNNKSHNIIYKNYCQKTKDKNIYYWSNSDIYFIDLYPDDLKNNFEGVRNKLISFFMSNFNIDILKEAS